MTGGSPQPIGYVFGYATLADSADYLVERTASRRPAVYGHVHGLRRVWNAAVENRSPASDHKHYVDPVTGARPDLAIVTLNVEPATGPPVNGLAVAVDAAALALFDRREYFLSRLDVTERFTHALGLPIWTYTATAEAVISYHEAKVCGRAVIRRAYYLRVVRAFKTMGGQHWTDFERSTARPECPLADLEIKRAAGDAGI